MEAEAEAAQRLLERAMRAVGKVEAAFGSSFSSGREENIGPLEQLHAIKSFVTLLEAAMGSVQAHPALLRLAGVQASASVARHRFAVAGLYVSAPMPAPAKVKDAKARTQRASVVSAWSGADQ